MGTQGRWRVAWSERRWKQALGLLILLVVGVGLLVPVLLRNPLPAASAGPYSTATLEPFDTTDMPTAIPLVSPGGTLRVIWRPSDHLAATRAGVLCVTADGPGHVCVTYSVGDRPAALLTREVERRGYHVQSLE